MSSLSMRSEVRGAGSLVLLTSGAALACSGEGAVAAMATASLVGLGCFVVSFAATLVAIVRARRLQGRLARGVAIVAVLLLAGHPTVWLGVTSGDCGRVLLAVGPLTAIVHGGLAGFLLLRKPAA